MLSLAISCLVPDQDGHDDQEVTVFGSVGLAFQDLAAGWLAYCRAKELGVGRSLDFLS
jgi:ornithine cyclodeaminase/alanine dehydrogenase-like protein (mu-crystallin family)